MLTLWLVTGFLGATASEERRPLSGRKPRGKVGRLDRELEAQHQAEQLAADIREAESQKEAEELRQATVAFRRALEQSAYRQDYILRQADALVSALRHAAQIEAEQARRAQMAIASAIAAQIEDEIRDEDETIALLLA
jgi:hypothetical protein